MIEGAKNMFPKLSFYFAKSSSRVMSRAYARVQPLIRLITVFCARLMTLTDPAVAVYVESVNFFDFFHELSHRVLRQLKLVFEGLDSVLNGVGFSLLAVHQAGLHNFPENAHFCPRFLLVALSLSTLCLSCYSKKSHLAGHIIPLRLSRAACLQCYT